MLIPAVPRIAASFANSPGRSGTSMSIWIIDLLSDGDGITRLQVLCTPRWSPNCRSQCPPSVGPCPSDWPTCGSRAASGSVRPRLRGGLGQDDPCIDGAVSTSFLEDQDRVEVHLLN